MRRRIIPYDARLPARARRLRREATVPERLLWSRLRRHRLGVRFTRQRAIGPFIVDFFAPAVDLVVEVDGRSHDARRMAYDLQRQTWLETRGLHVVRVTNDDVLHHLDEVTRALYTLVQRRLNDAAP